MQVENRSSMSWRQCKHWGFLGWRLVIAWYIFLHNIQENAFVTHFGWAEQGHIEPQLLCCTIQKSCVVQQQLNQLPLKQSCYVDSLRIDNSLWDGSIERERESGGERWYLPAPFNVRTSIMRVQLNHFFSSKQRQRSQLLGFSLWQLLHTSRYNWRVNASNILLYAALLLLPSFCPDIRMTDAGGFATSTSATLLEEFFQDIILDDPKLLLLRRQPFQPMHRGRGRS